jgi:hypothetical protein
MNVLPKGSDVNDQEGKSGGAQDAYLELGARPSGSLCQGRLRLLLGPFLCFELAV